MHGIFMHPACIILCCSILNELCWSTCIACIFIHTWEILQFVMFGRRRKKIVYDLLWVRVLVERRKRFSQSLRLNYLSTCHESKDVLIILIDSPPDWMAEINLWWSVG